MFTNEIKRLEAALKIAKKNELQFDKLQEKAEKKSKALSDKLLLVQGLLITASNNAKGAKIKAQWKALQKKIAENEVYIDKDHVKRKELYSNRFDLENSLRRLVTLTSFNNPVEIYEALNENVVGQDEAKKALATASFNNMLRIYKDIAQPQDKTRIDKDIVLMIGKTGTGKTLLVQELARILKAPVVIADATKVTQYGFTGDSVDSWVQELVDKAGQMATGPTGEGDTAAPTDTFLDEYFYKGIIFIDEFDKMSTRFEDSANNNSKNGLQFNLLKMIEGAIYHASYGKKSSYEADTRPVMFILGGAFSELDKEMEGKNSIGFSSSFVQKGIKRKITDEDIIKYGFSRELVGRITEIVQLDDMNEELLTKIATQGENSPVNRYKKLFELRNVKADIDDGLIKELAHKAIEMGTGARALNKVFKEFFRPYEFEAHKHAGKTLRFETAKPEAEEASKLSH